MVILNWKNIYNFLLSSKNNNNKKKWPAYIENAIIRNKNIKEKYKELYILSIEEKNKRKKKKKKKKKKEELNILENKENELIKIKSLKNEFRKSKKKYILSEDSKFLYKKKLRKLILIRKKLII